MSRKRRPRQRHEPRPREADVRSAESDASATEPRPSLLPLTPFERVRVVVGHLVGYSAFGSLFYSAYRLFPYALALSEREPLGRLSLGQGEGFGEIYYYVRLALDPAARAGGFGFWSRIFLGGCAACLLAALISPPRLVKRWGVRAPGGAPD